MHRRQKILLGLLEAFGGELSRTSLQKLLFLYCEKNADPAYGFVPYKFGCFSFQATADQRKLIDKGFLCDSEQWKVEKKANIADQLDYAERQALWALNKQFGSLSQRELVRHVYTSYPYYAMRSNVIADYLNTEEQMVVSRHVPRATGFALCSIGYEGLSLESYLNTLIRRDVRLVCDVRKNPLSRKFGFSKRALSSALKHMEIDYLHFPELGIVSSKRQELNTQADFDALFAEYERTTLNAAEGTVVKIKRLLGQKKRIAILCFEKLSEQCHRTRVVNAVLASWGVFFPLLKLGA